MHTNMDPRHQKALWGSESKFYTLCKTDTKEYTHPVHQGKVPYMQSRHAFTEFKQAPGEFKNLVEYREARKTHMEAAPVIARILDEFLYGYGEHRTFVFKTEEEFKTWKKKMDAWTLTVGEALQELRVHPHANLDDEASFRRFSGAIKCAGLFYPSMVTMVYDNLWPYRIGNHKQRAELSRSNLSLVKAAEAKIAQTLFDRLEACGEIGYEFACNTIRRIAHECATEYRIARNKEE